MDRTQPFPTEIKVLDHGYVRYIDHMGSDSRIVEAARVSYAGLKTIGIEPKLRTEEQNKKLLEYLWKNKHTSPFEMCKITLNIKMPIFVMRQYVRHRMQNLNEVSARYTELPNEFYRPKTWRIQDTKNKQSSVETDEFELVSGVNKGQKVTREHIDALLESAYTTCMQNYNLLLHAGIARELARIVLPVGIYTEIYACWDLKNLLHFITLRDDSHAQAEIQEYARAIKSMLVILFPWTMAAYEKYKFKLIESETK